MTETVWRCTCGVIQREPDNPPTISGDRIHFVLRGDHGPMEKMELHPWGTGAELERLRRLERRVAKASERLRLWLERDEEPEETPAEEIERLREERDDARHERDDWAEVAEAYMDADEQAECHAALRKHGGTP